jgi:uncharacterized membrane protein YdjX (TVP38/TMEM64 family)
VRLRGFLRHLGQLGPLAVAATLLPPIGSLILLGTIQHSSSWLRAQDDLGVLVFIVAFAFCGGFALLPTYTPALLGGWAFGASVGLIATLAGFAGAAGIGFALARRLSGDRLVAALRDYPRGLAIHDAFVGSGFLRALIVVTLVRLPPSSPFALSNVVMASSRVRIAPFLIGTVLGIAPRALAAVVVGAGLSRLDLAHPGRSGHVLIGMGLTLAALAALGWMATDALRRLERHVPRRATGPDVHT